MRWRTTLVCWGVVLMAGCDNNPVDPVVGSFSFREGQTWMYTWEAELSDSAGTILNAESDSLEVRVASINDEVSGMQGLVRLEARSFFPGAGVSTADTERVWYRVTSSEMAEVAYQHPAVVPLVIMSASGRSVRAPRRSFFDPIGATAGESVADTIMIREEPRRALKFPLKKGTAWSSFTNVSWSDKEVVAMEEIRAVGQVFSTAKIKTTLAFDSSGIRWFDWVAANGLIKRTIDSDVILATEGDPEATGQMVRHSEVLTLVGMN